MIQILLYSFVTGTQVLLVALALFLVYSVSKVQNLALGGIGMAVAYAFYFALDNALPLWVVFLVPFLSAIILGAVNFFLNEPFTKKQEYLFALLTSFSFAVALESVISIIFGTGGKSLIGGISPVYEFGSYQIPVPGLFIIGFGIVIGVILFFVTRYTPWGRTLKAIAGNSFSAVSLGVGSKKIRFSVYLLASLIAGAVGILVGFNTALTPVMGFSLIIMAFIAFLVGGVSDIKGTVVASYLITLIPALIISFSPDVSSDWSMVLVFAIAFVLLFFRPDGLFTVKERIS